MTARILAALLIFLPSLASGVPCSTARGLVNVSGGVYDGSAIGACVDPATQLDMETHEGASDPHTGYRLESVDLTESDITDLSHTPACSALSDSTTPGCDVLTAATAAAQRTALDVDQAGTDNSTDVTLSATGLGFWSIDAGTQVATLSAVDLTSDITGVLPAANGGTGQSALSSLNVNTLGSGAATLGQVPEANGSGGITWETPSGGGGISGDQYDIAYRTASGSGDLIAGLISELTEETAPTSGDFVLCEESGGALRKCDIGDLPHNPDGWGTSFPVAGDFIGGALPDGYQFYRQDRQILYVYEQGWKPMSSYGAITLYVDDSDSGDCWSSGTGACATLGEALDEIPANWGADITINVEAGTYAEDVDLGYFPSGPYTLTIEGTLDLVQTNNVDSATTGTGATRGTLTANGDFSGSHFSQLIYSSSADVYRLVASHTSNVVTLVGTWPSTPTGTYSLYNQGTTFSGDWNVTGAQQGLVLENMKFSGTFVHRGNTTVANNVRFTLGAEGPYLEAGSITFTAMYWGGSFEGVRAQNGLTRIESSMLNTTGSYGVRVRGGNTTVTNGTWATGATIAGVYAENGASVSMWAPAGNGYPRITSCTNGIRAQNLSGITNASNNVYSGNTTNVDEDSATFGLVN